MKFWLCLVLFMCLGLATSLTCQKCKNGCKESKEPEDCPGSAPGRVEEFWNGKLFSRGCLDDTSGGGTVGSYTCKDEDKKDGGQTLIITTCSCGEDSCNSNVFPLEGKCKDGKCSGAAGPTPWNNFLLIGLGLAFFIMH